jgi:hypothetical protein
MVPIDSGQSKPGGGRPAAPPNAVNLVRLQLAVGSERVAANPGAAGLGFHSRILVRAGRGCAGASFAVEHGTARHGHGRGRCADSHADSIAAA